jgi:CHAT domain-containing protein/tetratricopeptide (TPR) repeat protein
MLALLKDNPNLLFRMTTAILDRGDPGRCSGLELAVWVGTSATDKPGNTPPAQGLEDQATVAYCLSVRGQYTESETLYRRLLETSERIGGTAREDVLSKYAALLDAEGRRAEAEPLYRGSLQLAQTLGAETLVAAHAMTNLALFLYEGGNYADSEPLLRHSLAIVEKIKGTDGLETAAALNNVAMFLLRTGRYSESESAFKRALEILDKQRPEWTVTATVLSNYAYCAYRQRHYAEAEPLFARALAIREKRLRPDHPDTIGLHENIALNYTGLGRFEDAATHLRIACGVRAAMGSGHDLSGDAAQAARLQANQCATHYSLVLAAWAMQGGGAAPRDHAHALATEAFMSTQRALQSTLENAMARSAALAVATSAGIGPVALEYETVLRQRDNLNLLFAKSEGGVENVDTKSRQDIERQQLAAAAKVEKLESVLRSRTPLYWDFRSPTPISVETLQAKTGPDAVLLQNDEALVTFMVTPGRDAGIVFAVTKDKFTWARQGLSGADIRDRVMRLRAEIDPYGYRLSEPGNSRPAASPEASNTAPLFSRQTAHELYQALLGAATIQDVIRDKPSLLIVPSGPLTSLPPGLLVTTPPIGGTAGDADPVTLRATSWLLRSKAITLLPSVSALRTLRQILPATGVTVSDPLLAFADPQFSLKTSTAEAGTRAGPVPALRSLSTYFRSGGALEEALATLPPLPGTRIEGEALRQALGAPPESLLTGLNASKAELMKRNADGRLAKVRVLEFATHGLIAGDIPDQTEPALVLAAGGAPEDELLLASEAATLMLNADWVLLSACNTASPDALGAEGLSGLARSFFYAGAKTLLVSHWAVRDDVAPRLIPAMLLATRKDPHLSRAQALRQASLAILDDRSIDAASPGAWALFTLVGEGGH